MKLAEALLERKSIKEQIQSLKEWALKDARVQEGDDPSELPEKIIADLELHVSRLEELVIAINKTNNITTLPDGKSLMEAIAQRDMLKMRHQMAKDLANAAAPERDSWRHTRSEVKFKPTIDIAEWRRKADSIARDYRELDATIQAANWSTDLI
jgi:hypothetical protein